MNDKQMDFRDRIFTVALIIVVCVFSTVFVFLCCGNPAYAMENDDAVVSETLEVASEDIPEAAIEVVPDTSEDTFYDVLPEDEIIAETLPVVDDVSLENDDASIVNSSGQDAPVSNQSQSVIVLQSESEQIVDKVEISMESFLSLKGLSAGTVTNLDLYNVLISIFNLLLLSFYTALIIWCYGIIKSIIWRFIYNGKSN